MERTPSHTSNITAVFDLLGFNSYINLGKNDLRTPSGRLAVDRLNILKETVKLVNKDSKENPEYYPQGFFIRQITDSLIISADIDKIFLPSIGSKIGDIGETYSRWKRNIIKNRVKEKSLKDIGCLLGAIAKVHFYINLQEELLFFPGCRTTVSSGIRLKSSNKHDDMLSTNFAFSSAWIVNEGGKEIGIEGANLYIENSIASIFPPGSITQKLFRLSKFENLGCWPDPYQKYNQEDINKKTVKWEVVENKPFKVTIDDLTLRFRKANPWVLTKLQTCLNNPNDESYKKCLELLKLTDEEILKSGFLQPLTTAFSL
jgi:hypothetical protein